jgi:hypothetical protein
VSDIEAPVDPKSTFGFRAARLAVIVLTALIILSLIVLVVGFALKLTGHSTHASHGDDAPAAGEVFILPPGTKILSKDVQPGRLILQLHGPDGDEIDIVSTDDGHLIARIKASAAPARP